MLSSELVRKTKYGFDHTRLCKDFETIVAQYPFDDTNKLHLAHLPYVEDKQQQIYWGSKQSASGSFFDFSVFNPAFRQTCFYDIHQTLKDEFELGLMILNRIPPQTAGVPHTDNGRIYVVPISEIENSYLLFPDAEKCLQLSEGGRLYHFDSKEKHLAINTSQRDRVNLVIMMRPKAS